MMTKAVPMNKGREPFLSPEARFYGVLVLLVLATCLIALTGNPAGPFLAAFVSTALVIFGLFELARRLRHSIPVGRIWAVLGVGIFVGLFVNMATVLSPGIYVGFLFGQALTVGLVLWLVRSTRTDR